MAASIRTQTPLASEQPTKRFVRGWVVVGGLFALMAITSGFAFYAQGVFLSALIDEQGFSTGLAGAGTGAFFYTSGIFGYFAGGLISRYDVRWVMTWGAVIGAVGMALVGEVRTEWQLFAVMVLFGIGFALTGLVPSTTVVTRWFHRRRSVALSIASTGLSVGGIAIAPVLAAVIDRDTLEESALTFAVIFFISVLVVLWLFVRSSPESLGLRPDGDPAPVGANAADPPPAPPGTSFKAAVRSRYFVFMSAGFVLIMGAQVGVIQHAFNLAKDRVSLEAAQAALIALSATSVVARILGGQAAQRVPLRLLTSFLVLVQCGGITILALADNLALVLVGAIVMGSSVGNLLMLHPLLLSDAFGVRNYARIYGMGSLLMVMGVGTGPLVVGVIRDASSYRLSFFVLVAVCIAGLTLYRLGGLPSRDYLKEAPVVVSTGMRPAEEAELEAGLAAELEAELDSERELEPDKEAEPALVPAMAARLVANGQAEPLANGLAQPDRTKPGLPQHGLRQQGLLQQGLLQQGQAPRVFEVLAANELVAEES